MARIKSGILQWDLSAISNALKLSETDVIEYFTDGRRVSFVLERRIAYEVLKGRLASSEGAGFDLFDASGKKWEVRSITGGGIYFCPSYMVGSGRKFEEKGFLQKLDEIEGYIVSDVESFPNIPFWMISKVDVLHWYKSGRLGAGTKISRRRAIELVERG